MRTSGIGFLLLLATPVVADTACSRDTAEPRAYLDCLTQAQQAGEQRLERALAGALAAIAARAELQPVQRNRWTTLINESQGRFTHWRNFECQSIAPYEGGGGQRTVGGRLGGIGVMEQRLVCLTSLNDGRAADLEQRYPPPPGWNEDYARQAAERAAEAQAEAKAIEAQTPAAPLPAGPVRIIEMPAQNGTP